MPVEARADSGKDAGSRGATQLADVGAPAGSCGAIRLADEGHPEDRTLPHDVQDGMYWQSVEDLEVEKTERAKYEKRLRRANHIQCWQQKRKRKVRPKMERERLEHKAGASTENVEADTASSGNGSPREAPVDPREDAGSSGVTQPADDRPPCAGVGDADSLVWACWSCLIDLCAKKPKMPWGALANDN